MISDETALRALRATQFDACDSLFWRVDNGALSMHVICSDDFSRGASDSEPITDENVADLERAVADVLSVCDLSQLDGTLLFVARVRRRLPLQSVLREMRPRVRALFEAIEVAP